MRSGLFRFVVVYSVVLGTLTVPLWLCSKWNIAEMEQVFDSPSINIFQPAVANDKHAPGSKAAQYVGRQPFVLLSRLVDHIQCGHFSVAAPIEHTSGDGWAKHFPSVKWFFCSFSEEFQAEKSLNFLGWSFSSILQDKRNTEGLIQRDSLLFSSNNSQPSTLIEPLSFSGNLILIDHLSVLLARNMCVVSGGGESSSGSAEHKAIKYYLPPWNLVMAAFTGLLGSWWGWRTLCAERRENIATFVFLSALCFWGYSVYGFLQWSEKF